jgi:hypothetical protein
MSACAVARRIFVRLAATHPVAIGERFLLCSMPPHDQKSLRRLFFVYTLELSKLAQVFIVYHNHALKMNDLETIRKVPSPSGRRLFGFSIPSIMDRYLSVELVFV